MTKRPAQTGEFAVGTFTFTIYNDREERLAPGTMRNIGARVYYPVYKDSVEGLSKPEYMSKNIALGLKTGMRIPIKYKEHDENGDNISDCYLNAPRIEGRKFPLVIFNHGLGGYRESNSFMCLEIASHGYVVISLSHPYDSCCAEFDDGTFVMMPKDTSSKTCKPMIRGMIKQTMLLKSKGSDREMAEKFDAFQKKYASYVMERVDECEKDTLAAIRYAEENLDDLIDFAPGIAATGHSLGGATAYMLCLNEPKVVCGINIDGALFGENMGRVLDKPFMQISCKGSVNVETRPYIDHTKPVYGAVFNKMQHIGFSDIKHFVNISFLVGKQDADLAHENVCRCHLEFFDAYLKKTKFKPELNSNDVMTIREYAPDRA